MPNRKIIKKVQEKNWKPKQPKLLSKKTKRYLDKNDELLNVFLSEIRYLPIYSNRRLISLINQAKEGDNESRRKIMESCSRFIVSIAKTFQSPDFEILDLIQEGFLGLWEAIDRYDPSKKVPFIHFASWWIKKRMVKYIWWYKTTVRLPENQHIALNKLTKFSTRFVSEYGRIPSIEELFDESKLPKWAVSKYLDIFNGGNVKEAVNIAIDDLQDRGPMDDAPSPEVILDREVRAKAIVQCLDTLKPKYKDFIKDCFGIGRPVMNMVELAKAYRLSIGGAIKRKAKILEYLRENCSNTLKPYLNID